MRVEPYLRRLAAEAIRNRLDLEADPALRPAKEAAHGDYQINGLLPLAKKLRKPPRQLAAPVAEALAAHPVFERVEVAGPGFINLRLDIGWVSGQLRAQAADAKRNGVPPVQRPERIVIDFSSPNIAKRMHVGHIRSTIIGDALVRLLRFAGHEVIGDNHLGDWGTQFGMLIAGMERFGDPGALRDRGIEELERVYLLASEAVKSDPAFADRARVELAKLHSGDPDNLAAWNRFVQATRAELDRVYERMQIRFDQWLGESAYQEMLPEVVDLLLERGIAREDQGAICVFFDDLPELGGSRTPFIVRKKDGAFLYATTDIATVLYRRDRLQAERAIYVVDQRQSLHFKQLFEVMLRLGAKMRLQHIGFGTVLGRDGRPLKTREGDAVRLDSLLDEAEKRAAELMQKEQGLNLDADQIAELSPLVGIGAIKYADLKQNRLSDYQFAWEKMLSFKGNSGPYLQYAHARIQSIFRKAGIEPEQAATHGPLDLQHATEIALGKHLDAGRRQ